MLKGVNLTVHSGEVMAILGSKGNYLILETIKKKIQIFDKI